MIGMYKNVDDMIQGPFYGYQKHKRPHKTNPETSTAMAWISLGFIALVILCLLSV